MKIQALPLIVLFLLTVRPILGQIDTPEPSPRCEINQRVGITQVKLDYSRPGIKGRKIFGDLVPYGEVWRTGANAVSTLETDGHLMVGEQKLVPGKYAILTVPGTVNWEVRVYKYERSSWTFYEPKEPLFALFTQPQSLTQKVETLTMSFADLTSDAMSLEIYWENTLISIPFTLNTHQKVLKNIDRFANDPARTLADDYFNAARYYAQHKYELDTAYQWIKEAIKLRKSEAYWMYRTKAEIETQLGLAKEAIESYEKSNELAAVTGNNSYIESNNRAIEALKKR